LYQYRSVYVDYNYSVGFMTGQKSSMIDHVSESRGFQNCEHSVERCIPVLPLTADARSHWPNGGWFPSFFGYGPCHIAANVYRHFPGCSMRVIRTDGNPPVVAFPTVDWSSLVDAVGSQLDGRMQTGQNLLVDVIQFSQTLAMLKHPFSSLTKLPKNLRKLSLGELSRGGASAFLEYKFGWENIYRSLAAVANVWKEVSDHNEYLRKTVDTWTHIGSRHVDTINNPNCGTLSGLSLGSGSVSVEITEAKQIAAFGCELHRNQGEHVFSTMEQISSRLGLRDLASALWDVVPYSFVVDWFTHVNRILERQPISWNSYTVRNMGYSLTRQLKARSKTEMIATFNGFPNITDHVYSEPAVCHKTYYREGGFPPSTSTVGLFGNLNLTQIAEGASLIVQRI